MKKQVSTLILSMAILLNTNISVSARKNNRRNAINKISVTADKSDIVTTKESNSQNSAMETETFENDNNEEIKSLLSSLQSDIERAKASCSGIKDDLKTIQILTGVSTGASGLGLIASETAFAVGLQKQDIDKNITKNKTDFEKMSLEELDEELDNIQQQLSSLNNQISEAEKKSKTLGNVRTGLMAGSIATSATSTITSGVSIKKLDDVISKIKDCNKAAEQVESDMDIIKSEIDDVEDLKDNSTFNKAENIVLFCGHYNIGNIKGIKQTLTMSTVISGVGTVASTAGTITSALANSQQVRSAVGEEGAKKEKNLNLASNIMAGVSGVTGVGSTAFNAISLSQLANDINNAEKCEDALK